MLGSTVVRDGIPTIVLDVEKVERELDSKVVVAAALAGRGVRAVVAFGGTAERAALQSGPLVWQGKGVVDNKVAARSGAHLADHLNRIGSAIVYIQDEGGMFQACSWREQLLAKHQLDSLRGVRIDRLCTWGRRQRDVIAEYAPEMAKSLRVTGSPRFDICSPRFDWMTRKEEERLRGQYGSFILACTRFGSINKNAFARRFGSKSWPSDLDKMRVADIWLTKWRQDMHDFAEFVTLVKEMAMAWPSRRIVLRPHPSEDLGYYEVALAPFANVSVVREGNVLNWIRAADLVVHSNCTTGVEAVLAGRPTLNLLPGDADRAPLDVEVACEAGTIARSVSAALDHAAGLLSETSSNPAWSAHARSQLNNLEADSIPILVDETLSAAREASIDTSRLVLPTSKSRRMASRLVDALASRNTRPAERFDAGHLEALLDGCRANGVGSARIALFSPACVVIEPASAGMA